MKDKDKRMSARKKAIMLAKAIRIERPDYQYLKDIFRHLRKILDVKVTKQTKRLPYVPSQEEMHKYYQAVWTSQNMQNMVIVKVLMYTGVRVGELVKIKLEDVDLNSCNIKINRGKGGKDRVVPFPQFFKETFAMHIALMKKQEATHLFESSWKRPYSERGVRKILMQYTKAAGMSRSISPHKLRHFLFTWMKKQGIDDALIQPYSGHESRQSLEIYSQLSITEAQKEYDKAIKSFPI